MKNECSSQEIKTNSALCPAVTTDQQHQRICDMLYATSHFSIKDRGHLVESHQGKMGSSTVSKNVSNGVRKVLVWVVSVLCLIQL